MAFDSATLRVPRERHQRRVELIKTPPMRDATTTQWADHKRKDPEVNTYDPSDGVIYVRMAQDTDPYARPVTSSRTQNRLPRGYANKSLHTRLRNSRS
jgi:hypothetical protein